MEIDQSLHTSLFRSGNPDSPDSPGSPDNPDNVDSMTLQEPSQLLLSLSTAGSESLSKSIGLFMSEASVDAYVRGGNGNDSSQPESPVTANTHITNIMHRKTASMCRFMLQPAQMHRLAHFAPLCSRSSYISHQPSNPSNPSNPGVPSTAALLKLVLFLFIQALQQQKQYLANNSNNLGHDETQDHCSGGQDILTIYVNFLIKYNQQHNYNSNYPIPHNSSHQKGSERVVSSGEAWRRMKDYLAAPQSALGMYISCLSLYLCLFLSLTISIWL